MRQLEQQHQVQMAGPSPHLPKPYRSTCVVHKSEARQSHPERSRVALQCSEETRTFSGESYFPLYGLNRNGLLLARRKSNTGLHGGSGGTRRSTWRQMFCSLENCCYYYCVLPRSFVTFLKRSVILISAVAALISLISWLLFSGAFESQTLRKRVPRALIKELGSVERNPH